MHLSISRLLKKRGIDDPNQLVGEEKQTFDEWQRILTKDELNVDDIRRFCQTQLDLIENKWADLNLDHSKKSEYIPYHTVYKLLLRAIDSPKAAKEALEQQLNQLIN